MRLILPALTTLILLLFSSLTLAQSNFAPFDNDRSWPTPEPLRTFFVDSVQGDDTNSGLSRGDAWQTLVKLSDMTFRPGDHVYFKRGRSFSGTFNVQGDGTRSNPIIIGAFGAGHAPRLTNPNVDHHNGNAIQMRGDHQIVQNLYFHHTAPAEENAGFLEVWATGAIHVGLGSDHAIIRGNQFVAVPKAIQSYSQHSRISHNFIHGINMQQQGGFLSKPYWGPIGIHLGIGNQEIAHNRIENMFVQGGEWGSDGGAIEIDDGRYHKNNIHIHHNTTHRNMGFLEISWEHDIQRRVTSNIVVEHNISRDYQDFVLWWAQNRNSRINNNTIIRSEQVRGMFTDTVFYLDGADVEISKNVIVVSDDTWSPLFQGDEIDGATHSQNLYWNIDGGAVDLGIAPGTDEVTANPLFLGFSGQDYRLRSKSPAIGLGAWAQRGQRFDTQAAGLARNFEGHGHVANNSGNTEPEQSGWTKVEDTDRRLDLEGGDTWRADGGRDSGGSTRTLWVDGHSIGLTFVGSQIRFHGLKDVYMHSFDIRIDGKVVARNVSAKGSGQWQAILWESDQLPTGTHSAQLISNGDTVEVDFITYR